METFESLHLTIRMKSQYHLGSGFGLGRFIDSLIKTDPDLNNIRRSAAYRAIIDGLTK